MSLLRGIWNDGQAIATPELQRPNDVGAAADDRVLEILATPGSAQKKVIPLIEESLTVNPRLLVLPGVTGGTVKLQPCQLVAGDATNTQAVDLSANLQSALQSALVGANSSGSTRIDLLYATISRSVPAAIGSPPAGTEYAGIGLASAGTGAQQARTIKDVASGNVTTQTINIYDVPTVTLTILAGTPGSGVPPSLPADSASAFNFSLAALTIASGYTSGAAITQSLITATWNGGWIHPQRVHGLRPMSIFLTAVNERILDSLSERWGGYKRYLGYFKMLSTTSATNSSGVIIDNSIDWRRRLIRASVAVVGDGSTTLANIVAYGSPSVGQEFPWNFVGSGGAWDVAIFSYNAGATKVGIYVDSGGVLRAYRNTGTPQNGANGDLVIVDITVSDQIVSGI